MMENKVILLGSGSGANAIRSALIDLTALGLIPELLWVNPDREGDSVEVYEHSAAEGLVEEPRSIAAVVRDCKQVLLVALDDIEDEGSYLSETGINRWADIIHSSKVDTKRLHLILSRLPLINRPIEPIVGWPRLVLAAEDSDTPSAPQTAKYRSDGPAELARYAAPAIAGLTGLWEGMNEVPVLGDLNAGRLDTESGSSTRLVRVYHRRIDATEIESLVREGALNVRDSIPQPTSSRGTPVTVAVDSDEVVSGITKRFSDVSRKSLFEDYEPAAKLESVQVSAWQTFKAFLSFFFRAVIGSPSDWGNAMKSSGQSAFASGMQNLLYGQESQIEVVCGNHSGKQRNFTVEQMHDVSAKLREQIASQNTNEFRVGPPDQLAAMWRTYQECALTLVDAEQRKNSKNFAPVGWSDLNPTVLSNTRFSVVDSSESFDGAHSVLNAQFGKNLPNTTVAPFDPFSAEIYQRHIDRAAKQSTDRSLTQKKEDFRVWKRNNSRSFGWAVGNELMGFIYKANEDVVRFRQEFDDIQRKLRELGAGDDGVDKRLLRAMRSITWGWLFFVIMMIYLVLGGINPDWKIHGNLAELSWPWGLTAVIVSTIIALVTEWLLYARARRGLYERNQQRQLLRKQEEIVSRNLARAIAAVERTTNAYAQHQAWSRVLGRAINFPFGMQVNQTAPVSIPEGGLPRATVIGRAEASDMAMKTSMQTLRNKLYPIGWAELSLNRLIDDANTAMSATVSTRYGIDDYSGMPGYGSGSQLDKLVYVAESPDLPRRVDASAAWSDCLANNQDDANTKELTSRMAIWEESGARTIETANILATFGKNNEGQELLASFADGSVNFSAANSGATDIDPEISRVVDSQEGTSAPTVGTGSGGSGGAGFSRTLTLIQYGRLTNLDSLQAIQ